ncbi:MAG: hydantoinase/oxoprolinase [Deltaproteobacteria bacterium]|nr:MAG: hydantoinase/oxoprolinase [Deltaproteobacteria bacterium]
MARIHVIGCAVLAIDIQQVAEKKGLTVSTRFLEAGLHNKPAELKRKLQAAIDKASGRSQYDRIAIGYGVCGLGTVGIQARNIPLVIPNAHDCIAMFLGSNKAYNREFARYPGTYYFSAGWCAEKSQPRSSRRRKAWMGDKEVSFETLEEAYGHEHAETVMSFLNSWQKNYQRAVFIDTGAPHKEKYAKDAVEMAGKYGWKHETIKGNLRLLEHLLTAEQTRDEVLVVPPGYYTAFDAIKGRLAAVPARASARAGSVSHGSKTIKREVRPAAGSRDAMVRFGLGVDAGGTYTDAVIYDFAQKKLRGKNKALTTRWDFTVGIGAALDGLNADLLQKVELVAVSTTLATNAIVEGEGQTVGLILMPPYGVFRSGDIPCEPKAVIDGQLEITGKEICPVNAAQVRQVARRMVEKKEVRAFAVSGFAGAVNPAHELLVKKILREETGLSVTCGHELSEMLDFRTRAQTAVLNAQIIPRLEKFIREMETVLSRRNILAPVVVVKGDGSLIAAEVARDRPVETVLSGPAASVAGAMHLTGYEDAIVVDIGGTTTDTAGLKSGQVRVCESGTVIGGYKTHVRALDMRTAGLGGDSLIQWKKGQFVIGPQRVAPISWAGFHHDESAGRTSDGMSAGFRQVFRFMANRLHLYRSGSWPMQVLTRVGQAGDLLLRDEEKRILALLEKRPCSLDELAQHFDTGHWRLLNLERLEMAGVIQRCGLTPTDLLHVTGRFNRWDTETAGKMCELFCEVTGWNQAELIDFLLDRVVRRVAMELLKKQLDEEVVPDDLEACDICRALMNNLFTGGTDDYRVRIDLHRPVIGIGAPAMYFVPRAGEVLGTKAILPPDADVANAVGAITSQVRISRQVQINPGNDGEFIITGVEGARSFTNFDQASDWAMETLKDRIIILGRSAGTSREDVKMSVADNISTAADGAQLFLGRTITAYLKGRPDLIMQPGTQKR